MSELISVIMPVYNCESRLGRTLDSVVGQTYENIEIILVDDGSTDKTPDICDEYKQKYTDKIVVKHISNSGVSVARNTGLDLANGKYIAWCDGDDFMDPEMVTRLYGKIREYDADIVCEYYVLLKDGVETLPTVPDRDIVYEGASHVRVFDNFFDSIHRGMTTVLWDKLYKREVFDNMRFKPGVTYEDKRLMHHILDNAGKIVYLNSYGYTYYISNDGITGTRSFKTATGDYEAAIDRYEFIIGKNDTKLSYLVTYDLLTLMVFYYRECIAWNEKEKASEVRHKFRTIFKLSNKNLRFNRIKDNIKFTLFSLNII